MRHFGQRGNEVQCAVGVGDIDLKPYHDIVFFFQ